MVTSYPLGKSQLRQQVTQLKEADVGIRSSLQDPQ